MEPLEIAETGTIASFDPSRTIEPLPNCFSIWVSVSPSVLLRSFSSMMVGPFADLLGGISIVLMNTESALYVLLPVTPQLQLWRVVTFTGPHQQVFAAFHPNVHRMVQAI